MKKLLTLSILFFTQSLLFCDGINWIEGIRNKSNQTLYVASSSPVRQGYLKSSGSTGGVSELKDTIIRYEVGPTAATESYAGFEKMGLYENRKSTIFTLLAGSFARVEQCAIPWANDGEWFIIATDPELQNVLYRFREISTGWDNFKKSFLLNFAGGFSAALPIYIFMPWTITPALITSAIASKYAADKTGGVTKYIQVLDKNNKIISLYLMGEGSGYASGYVVSVDNSNLTFEHFSY